jgi:hypothetical protein
LLAGVCREHCQTHWQLLVGFRGNVNFSAAVEATEM